jgi:cytochrome c-type biogenesis protein CcmH
MKLLIRKPSFWVGLALILGVAVVWTVTVVRSSQPKTLDQRTYEVASQLQCPVCHGESVADAPSPLAQEMRSLIREDLSGGMSEQQVIAYFHQRYGDEILETPPTSGFTLLIWLGPLLVLLFGLTMLVEVVRDSRRYRTSVPGMPLEADSPREPRDELREPGEDWPAEASGGLSQEERERYHALLLAEIDALEGYPEQASAKRDDYELRKGGAAV